MSNQSLPSGFIHGFLMASLGIFLLTLALVSQHAFGYEPCTLCIEIRFWLAAGSLMAFAGALISLCKNTLGNALGSLAIPLYAAAAFWSAKLVLLERGVIQAAGCSPFTFYHQTLPLGEWLPSVFEVRGMCGEPAIILDLLAYSELSLIGISLVMVACIAKAPIMSRYLRNV